MREIELKILNINKAKIKRALSKLGARRTLKPILVKELFFEFPGIKNRARKYSSFRLRLIGKRAELTVKIRKNDKKFKVYDEIEVEVSDFKTAKQIIETLGFKVFRHREKIREEYKFKDIKLEIDEYPGLNAYLEIEGQNKKSIEEFLKLFGYSLKQTTPATATELLKSSGLNPDFLVFKK